MNIFIYHIPEFKTHRKDIFNLCRPFYLDGNWGNFDEVKNRFKINTNINYVSDIENADLILIADPINTYFDAHKSNFLKELSKKTTKLNKKVFGYIGGDFGTKYREYENIIYFRMGGFKQQLSEKNLGFPVSISCQLKLVSNHEYITPKTKLIKPTIGFCGHATLDKIKYILEVQKYILINMVNFFKNPLNAVYEPLFASAYERAKLLQNFEKSPLVKTNFIYRKNYRAGAITESERTATTIEYYNNILNSDYVLCVRGAGNFSVRFYETLMMGKIPIFVNTNCLLPFENKIDWKKHVVWVEWNQRNNIAKIVADFHTGLSNQQFIYLQKNNRKLWANKLSLNNMIKMINETS